jgi:hypothetical protein
VEYAVVIEAIGNVRRCIRENLNDELTPLDSSIKYGKFVLFLKLL